MQKKILVIDDDPNLVAVLYHSLTEQGYEVYKAHDGQEGLWQIYSHQPDLIILDIIMPELDGWQVCRRTREMSDVPIIMLTIRGRELLARVRSVLRRAAPPPPTEEPVTYCDGYLTVNLTERRVVVRGEPVKLTPTEFRLLAQLVENAGRALTYNQLLEKVWGWEYRDDIDYVRIYIWHLRQRIEKDPRQPQYILTEYGVGYRFDSRGGSNKR
jgi:two-component system KDP operon response regulator KdpE